ncbi:hypothetical protein HC891_17040 [Candidatus Gracilibacteria bacterium]|nr:hypothetical protein [Candidatus Gracilibacteria bacterium]
MHIRDRSVRASLDLFRRTYHSLLRSSGEIEIQALVEPFAACEPSLHHEVQTAQPDVAAITYTSLRLPTCIDAVRLVLLGQSHEVFARHGFGDVERWQPVSAPDAAARCFSTASTRSRSGSPAPRTWTTLCPCWSLFKSSGTSSTICSTTPASPTR